MGGRPAKALSVNCMPLPCNVAKGACSKTGGMTYTALLLHACMLVLHRGEVRVMIGSCRLPAEYATSRHDTVALSSGSKDTVVSLGPAQSAGKAVCESTWLNQDIDVQQAHQKCCAQHKPMSSHGMPANRRSLDSATRPDTFCSCGVRFLRISCTHLYAG